MFVIVFTYKSLVESLTFISNMHLFLTFIEMIIQVTSLKKKGI